MISLQGFPARGVALACALLTLLSSARSALAQDETADDDVDLPATDGEGESPPDEVEGENASTPEGAEKATAEASVPPGERDAHVMAIGLERLPPSGYPAPHVRGIRGGSMWMTMHGLQWPYMPARGDEGATRLAVSGNAWVDTSYRDVDSGADDTDPDVKEWRQQARGVFRLTPTYNAPGSWFVQAQGELVLEGAGPADAPNHLIADDLYVRTGKWNAFDVTAGRFQGWEIYHLGMGLDLNTVERAGARTEGRLPVDLYGATYYWDRSNGPGRLAVHYYPTDYLRFEVMGHVGSSALNSLAVRPVAILDLGVFKAKVGAEYGKDTPRQQSDARKDEVQRSGVAGTLQTVIDPFLEAGVAFAVGTIDSYNAQGVLDAGRSSTTTSYGGFVNVRVAEGAILGGGVNFTMDHNLKVDVTQQFNDERSHLQAFGAAQYAFWNQLYVKLVVAYADAHYNPLSDPPPISEFHNKSLSGRLRLLYTY